MGYKRYGNSGSVPTFNDDNNGEAVLNGILTMCQNDRLMNSSDKKWQLPEMTRFDMESEM